MLNSCHSSCVEKRSGKLELPKTSINKALSNTSFAITSKEISSGIS